MAQTAGIASYADNQLAAETKGGLILDEFNTPRTVRPLAGTTSYDDYQLAALAERKQQLREELNIPSNIEDFDVGFFEYLKQERTRNYIVELNMGWSKEEAIDKRKVITDAAVNMAIRVMEEVCGSGGQRNIMYLVGNMLCCKLRDHELRRMKGREDLLSVTLDRPDCKVACEG